MEENYYELTIKVGSQIELFKELLFELCTTAVEERENSLILRDQEPLDDIEWAVKLFAQKLQIAIETKIEIKQNRDWIKAYQQSINPIEVASFYVRPQWEAGREGLTNIIINPALAFGSGHHETTSSCLEVIDAYVQEGDKVIDVGCGSGILSIAAAKKGAVVDICDTDELSIESAKSNFALNDVPYHKAWIGSVNQADSKYDIVLANIIADVLIFIKKDLKNALKSDGILVLSGIIEDSFDKIVSNFSEFQIDKNIKKGEWHTVVLKRDEEER